MRYLILTAVLLTASACAEQTVRETVQVRIGGGTVQCSEAIPSSRSNTGRLGGTIASIDGTAAGVNLSVPLQGAETSVGPTNRCEVIKHQAEEMGRLAIEQAKAELRQTRAEADIAEARAEAERRALARDTADLEAEW